MTYRTPESLIRSIMAGQSLNESHAPALKIPEPERVADALKVLHDNGIASATKQDENTITVSAADVNNAANILDHAIQNGVIQAKPMMVSAEAVPVPEVAAKPVEYTHEPHPPEGGVKMGEEVEEVDENCLKQDEDETEQNVGKDEGKTNISLNPRSLNNRMQNQIKKIDEEEQIDELSSTYTPPKRVPQRMIKKPTAEKVAGIADKKGMGKRDVENVLFNQGHGRKSSKLIDSIRKQPQKLLAKEEAEQINELSVNKLKNYDTKAKASGKSAHGAAIHAAIVHGNTSDTILRKDMERVSDNNARKAENRNFGIMLARAKATKHPAARIHAREETELTELSYGKLKSYTTASFKQVEGGHPLDKKIANRKAGIAKAKEAKVNMVQRAAGFKEEYATPTDTVLRVISEAGSLRLIATHNSECGKHTAKVYKDHEWGEHRVKFFIHGKHHEPADYHCGDVEDAHETARAELKRMTKLNGALKEAIESGEDLSWLEEEIEQVDELSKATLGSYVKTAAINMSHRRADMSHAQDANAISLFRTGSKDPAQSAEIYKNAKTILKREKGINTAVNKLVKEEVTDESDLPFQIDELSKGTLARYIRKSSDDRVQHVKKADMYHRFSSKDYVDGKPMGVVDAGREKMLKHSNKSYNRKDGIDIATRKLAEGKMKEVSHDLDNLDNGNFKKKYATDKESMKSKLKESIELAELSRGTLARYVQKAAVRATGLTDKYHEHTQNSEQYGSLAGRAQNPIEADKLSANSTKHDLIAHKAFKKTSQRLNGIYKATNKLAKEEFVTEGKKEDVEKAKKHLFKHKEADAIGRSMHTASRHFTYAQDAMDHVYNNHCKDVGLEDFDKIKPHLEDHFKKHGLK